jgi:two-component system, chemotaxis family, CheB/CheR fusion protein
VIWGFAIFRRLLRETVEEIATIKSREDVFAAREFSRQITDRSEIGSIHQYLDETSQERDTARQALREANQQKDRFLAVLSHELRNPLAAMQRHFTSFKANSYSEAQKRHAFEIIDRRPKFIRDWLTICWM